MPTQAEHEAFFGASYVAPVPVGAGDLKSVETVNGRTLFRFENGVYELHREDKRLALFRGAYH